MQSIFVCFYEFLRSSFFALQNYLIEFLGGFAEEEYNATEFRVWEFQCFSALPSSSPNNCFYAEERFFLVGGRSLLLAFFVCSWIENTTVLAAVYGPKSVTGKKENPEYASLEVIWKPKSGLSGNVLCSLLFLRCLLFLTCNFSCNCSWDTRMWISLHLMLYEGRTIQFWLFFLILVIWQGNLRKKQSSLWRGHLSLSF